MQDEVKPRARKGLFKSRYLIAAWLAVELLSLPAAAQVVQRVSFKVEPHVVAAPIRLDEPGVQHFVVASNSPFTVTASNMIGEVDVSVDASGTFKGLSFGDAAQLPGDAQGCAMLLDTQEQAIYRATRKTAAKRGKGSDQAVVMTFRYNPVAKPEFSFSVEDRPVVAGICGMAQS